VMTFQVSEVMMVVAAYVLGSLPFGLVVARARGVDIRKVGSGNIGATNVFRCVGKPWGILVFFLDFLKGLVPAILFPSWFLDASVGGHYIAAGVAAVVGHNWPVWLRFKGGKGVATSAGLLAGIAPLPMVLALGSWILLFFTTRYVSVASMGAGVVVGISGWVNYAIAVHSDMDTARGGLLLPVVLTVLALLVIVRHRHNISRLINGTEPRFKSKKDDGASMQSPRST